MRGVVFVVFFLFFFFTISAQIKYSDVRGREVMDEDIGSIQFYPAGNPLGLPIISLYGREPLQLIFDVFTTQQQYLSYKIELCDYQWNSSELDFVEFIDGFEDNYIDDISPSFNTTMEYLQYRLELPNENIRFLKSGNYIIRIFDEQNVELFQRRFVVYEPLTDVTIELDILNADRYSGHQYLKATINPHQFEYAQLAGNIHLSVMQNSNWMTTQIFQKTNTNTKGYILYNTPGQIIFDGINEFRFFDIKSFKYMSGSIAAMDFKPPYQHIYLKSDFLRGEREFFPDVDLSGDFYIWNQESNDPKQLDAEYAWVHFTLNTEIPLGEDVYLEGAITDWKYETNHMNYNPGAGSYELSLLLKQGIYNYRYVTKEFRSGLIYSDITEGNHFMTGNDYHAFLYYRKPGDFNDRVIGYGKLSTGSAVEEWDKNQEPNIIQQILKEIAPR
jgi:hypothetical protein